MQMNSFKVMYIYEEPGHYRYHHLDEQELKARQPMKSLFSVTNLQGLHFCVKLAYIWYINKTVI